MRLSYLATPYTHPDSDVRRERYKLACRKAAELMLAGDVIFCPIAHSHPLAEHMPAAKAVDGGFWQRQDSPYIHACDELIVYMMPGWQESSGVTHETAVARDRGIPIRYIA